MENINDLSPEQKQAILRKREEMLAKMGVKNGGKMINESIVSTNPASSGMAAKIAAIRNGSAKSEINQYINATSKNAGNGNGGFNAIPEPKAKKNPNQQEVNPEYRQKLEDNFGSHSVSNAHELSNIEALFGSDSPSRMPVRGGQDNQSAPIADLSIDNIAGPVFNPQAAVQRAREKAHIQNQSQNQNQYLKYASSNPISQEEFVEANQNNLNLSAMQIMMETIAKGIAEKTIRNVLNEYTEQNKNKTFFEYYNKEKAIIKTQDGKLYKLTPVEIRKKTN